MTEPVGEWAKHEIAQLLIRRARGDSFTEIAADLGRSKYGAVAIFQRLADKVEVRDGLNVIYLDGEEIPYCQTEEKAREYDAVTGSRRLLAALNKLYEKNGWPVCTPTN